MTTLLPRFTALGVIGLATLLIGGGARAAKELDQQAPSIKVLKVKGNRAVVVFSKKRLPLRRGMVGNVIDSEVDSEMKTMEGPSKDNFIGLEGGFSMLKSKINGSTNDTKSDQFDLSLIYGWNTGTFEFGPLINLSLKKSDTFDTKTIEVGGQIDYNFNKNDLENSIVYAARFVGAVGQQDNSAQSKAATSTRIEPGVVMKWFGLDANLATLASLSYRIQSVSLDSAKTTTDGIVLRLGIQTYF